MEAEPFIPTESEADFNPALYPSIDLAYPLAIASYEVILKRLDSLDARVQGMMTFAATMTLAVPVFLSNKGISFHSRWFWLTIFCFVAGSILGTLARIQGTLKQIDPGKLYTHYLGLSEAEFKKDTIYYAGVNLAHNNDLVEKRFRLMVAMNVFYLAEVAAMAFWAASVSWYPGPGSARAAAVAAAVAMVCHCS